MKALYVALALLISTNAFAARKGAPFHPHDDKRFDSIENQLESTTEAANLARKSARFVYDVAVDGGESTSHSLGVTIPAGSIITAVHLYINSVFTDSGAGSVALQCAGTGDLLGYTDLTALGIDFVASRVLSADSSDGTAYNAGAHNAAFVHSGTLGASVPTACTVTAVVRSDAGYVPQTAGKLTGIIEYFSR